MWYGLSLSQIPPVRDSNQKLNNVYFHLYLRKQQKKGRQWGRRDQVKSKIKHQNCFQVCHKDVNERNWNKILYNKEMAS